MRMMKKTRKYILLSLICFFSMLGILTSVDVQAATPKGSIHFQFDQLEGVEFKLYRVGEQDKHDGYRLVAPFDAYSVDLFDINAAETLASYIERDKVDALWTKKTDENGQILFDDLEEGAYLIIGQNFSKVVHGDMVDYEVSPVMISLPQKDDQGNLIWDIDVNAKYRADKVPEEEDKSKYFVQKIWKDNNASDRPEEIIVQLLEDGSVKEEIALNDSNNWSYKWTDLDPYATYKIVEKNVPAGYTVSSNTVGINKTVLTNTKDTPLEEKTTHKKPGNHKKPHDKKKHKLPQTGQMWWPVGLFLCVGLLFLILGFRVDRRREDD